MGIPFTKNNWSKEKIDGPKKKPMTQRINFLKEIVHDS